MAVYAVCLGAALPATGKAAEGNFASSSKSAAEAPKAQTSDNLALKAKANTNKAGPDSKVSQGSQNPPHVGTLSRLLGFMDRHNGALNAIFSGFVALFTLMLFLVGRDQHSALKASVTEARRAGDAATDAAQAAINVELPTLTYVTAGLARAATVGEDGRNRFDTVEQALRFPRFEITVKNYGRTPAFVSAVGADTFLGGLPEKPIWIEYFDLDSSVVIEPKEPYKIETVRRKSVLSDAEILSVIEGSDFWICWFITYRDFLGRKTIYRDARRLYVLNADGAHVFLDEAPDAYKGTSYAVGTGYRGQRG